MKYNRRSRLIENKISTKLNSSISSSAFVENESLEIFTDSICSDTNEKTNITTCPKCIMTVEYIGGCKYIQCQTPFCKGKTYFCLICKSIVALAYKDNHFPDGVFSAKCKNKS